MYTAYVDGDLFYAPNLVEEGFAISSARITEETNKAGSFTFTLLPENPEYDGFYILKSVVTVKDGDTEIFRGRPVEVSRGFQNAKTIRCEGWLSVLLDSVVRPYEFSGTPEALFTKLITDHNGMVDADKQLYVGDVTVTDPNNYIARASSEFPATWDEIEDKLIELLGGYVRHRRQSGRNYVDYLADYGSTSNQVIEFGKNLLSFDEFISVDDLYTAIIPFGARDEDTEQRLDIKSVNGGLDYLIDNDAVTTFGTIWHVEYWDDVTIAANLKTKAQQRLAENVLAAVSLQMRAFDLHVLDVDTDAFKVGDLVRVVSLPHGVDSYFMCSRIERDLLRPEQSTFNFGLTYKTLTGQTRSQIKTVAGAIESIINVPPTV